MVHSFVFNPQTAVITTNRGKVRGYFYDDVYMFKGIPYAKAKRFHAPEPADAWEDVFDATSYGYVCPLLGTEKPNGELMVPHRYWPMNENCQNLNVWTPACDDKKRPVMVWLHGGGYEAGSAIEQLAYEGENMAKVGDVVVVSVNHRLNILGYFDMSGFGAEYANSANAGTDDIIMALKWVRDNIASFGGDPGNVTVFGQSGGGGKVTTLLQTPAADGLYAKGINMSGVIGPVLADSKGDGKDLVQAVMKELGVKDAKTLEKVPYYALADAYLKVRPKLQKEGKYVGCTPHPNAFYAGDPAENGFRKETANIPLMVGSVYGEFTSFMPTDYDKHIMTVEDGKAEVTKFFGEEAAKELLPLFEKAYPQRNPVDLLTLDFMFRLPTMQYIKLRSSLNDCTYAYLFNHDLPVDGGRTPWHCADIPYVFHNTELIPVTQENIVEQLENQVFESVMAFARTGNPNNETIPAWPASNADEEHTMIFDNETCLCTNHDAQLLPLFAKYMEPIFAHQFEERMKNVQH